MNKMWNWLIATVSGVVATIFEQYAVAFTLLSFAIVFDLITGTCASIVDGTGLNSEKSKKGLVVKGCYYLAFGFGIFLDFAVEEIMKVVHIENVFNSPFALIIVVLIIINECISICENFYRINPSILPEWLIKILSIAKKEINQKDAIENIEENQGGNK